MIGVALVIAGSATSSNGETTLLGSVLVFLGVLCWTAYTIMLQPYTKRIDVVQLAAVTMVGGAVPLLVASMPALVATDWSSVGTGGLGGPLFSSGVSLGGACFFCFCRLPVLCPPPTPRASNLSPN